MIVVTYCSTQLSALSLAALHATVVINYHLPVDPPREYNQYDEAALWIMKCKHSDQAISGPCPMMKYSGRKDLASLAAFFKAVDQPPIVSIGYQKVCSVL